VPGMGEADWAYVQLVSSAPQTSRSGIVRISFQRISARPGQQEHKL